MELERRENDARWRGEVELEMMNSEKGPKPTVGEHGQMHGGTNTCRDAFLKECREGLKTSSHVTFTLAQTLNTKGSCSSYQGLFAPA